MFMIRTLAALAGLLTLAPADAGFDREAGLETILACNAEAQGAGALAGLDAVRYRLEITEPGFTVNGHYRATRDGRVRIDIRADGERVFAEGIDGEGEAWTWQRGDSEARPASPEGHDALRHGVQQPGHFHALSHMAGNGHAVTLAGFEERDGTTHAIVELRLSDGFRQWYGVSGATCLVERNRSFRAFHPDQDPDATWIETRYSDFREVDGVRRAFSSEHVDLATGEVIGTVRVLEYRPDPVLAPDEFQAP